MDVRTISAAQKYAASRPATIPDESHMSIGDAIGDKARDFATTLQDAEATAKSAMVGDADPHALVQALAQSELAVETVVTLRDKVVEAYQEILRMPV